MPGRRSSSVAEEERGRRGRLAPGRGPGPERRPAGPRSRCCRAMPCPTTPELRGAVEVQVERAAPPSSRRSTGRPIPQAGAIGHRGGRRPAGPGLRHRGRPAPPPRGRRRPPGLQLAASRRGPAGPQRRARARRWPDSPPGSARSPPADPTPATGGVAGGRAALAEARRPTGRSRATWR